jgi:GNAT superfamily N-acetyltransferase
LQVSDSEFRPFVTALFTHAFKSGLSWVAFDNANHTLAGVRVVTDCSDDFVPQKSFGNKMDTILEFLHTISKDRNFPGEMSHQKTVHSHMVAIHPSYQKLGIAQALLKNASNWAFQKGYKTSVGEVTNQYNAKILSRIASYQEIRSIQYEQYEAGGQMPFRGLKGHERCTFFQFSLSDFSGRVKEV